MNQSRKQSVEEVIRNNERHIAKANETLSKLDKLYASYGLDRDSIANQYELNPDEQEKVNEEVEKLRIELKEAKEQARKQVRDNDRFIEIKSIKRPKKYI